MSELKTLLDQVAGTEPAVTDSDLSADLRRGRRAVLRRRTAGAAGVAMTTAAAIGAAYLLAPGTSVPGTTDAPAASSSSSASMAASVSAIKSSPSSRMSMPPGPMEPQRPPMVWADEPVPLVPNTKVPRGATITCDLMPKGWVASLRDGGYRSEIMVTDPKSTYPSVEPPNMNLGWDKADGNSVFYGSFGDKVGNGWAAQVTAVVDGKQVAMFTNLGNTMQGRPGEVFVRLSSKVTIQAEIGPRTGWDAQTAARWAASCHPVR